MLTSPSILKRAYDAVALFAILNMLAVGGLVVCLIGTGGLNADKARRVLGVLRGEDVPTQEPKTVEEPRAPATAPETPPIAENTVAETQMDIEIMRREGERIKAELDQRLALNNAILLRVMTQRERFQHEREEAARRRETAAKQRHEDGFKKQVAIYESLAPKIAVQHLLALSEPDDAARILLEMETRKAKKIVEAAKRGDRMDKMKVIMRRLREVAPDRSAELQSKSP